MLKEFEGAREAFALVGQALVTHAVQNKFADLPAEQMKSMAIHYVNGMTEVVVPYIEGACREARAAGAPAEQINDQVAVTMNDFTAMMQDALRDCGLNIEIVLAEIQGPPDV